jgi:hypothetical protein
VKLGASLLLVFLVVTVAACDDEPQRATGPQPCESTPPTVTPNGDIVISNQRDITINGDEFDFGDCILITGQKWSPEGTVRFYLLTEAQGESTGAELLNADLTPLGEATATRDGNLTFETTVSTSYQTGDRKLFKVRSGDVLYIMAAQGSRTSSVGSVRGPIEIR